jgi:hypothetical protein
MASLRGQKPAIGRAFVSHRHFPSFSIHLLYRGIAQNIAVGIAGQTTYKHRLPRAWTRSLCTPHAALRKLPPSISYCCSTDFCYAID